LVLPGVTGYLVPPADPLALADAISSVYMNPIDVARMVKAGQALVTKEFNIEHNARQLSALFEQFLCQARVPEVGRIEVHPICG